GNCFTAVSPLLGATGTNGEYWTMLANILMSSNAFDSVIIAPAAVGGSDVARWAPKGDLNPLLVQTAADLMTQSYRPTHVLWHQGENDLLYGTGESEYTERFLGVVDTLRAAGIKAPVLVSIASKCSPVTNFAPNNAV